MGPPGPRSARPGEFLVDEDDSALLVRIGWSVVIEAARRARRVAARASRTPDHGVGQSVGGAPREARPVRPRRAPAARQPGAGRPTPWRSRSRSAPSFPAGPGPATASSRCATSAWRSWSTTSARPRPATDGRPVRAARLRSSSCSSRSARSRSTAIKLDPSFVDRLDGGVADVVDGGPLDRRPRRRGRRGGRGRGRARAATRASISPRDSSSIARNRPRTSTVCSRRDAAR